MYVQIFLNQFRLQRYILDVGYRNIFASTLIHKSISTKSDFYLLKKKEEEHSYETL